MLAAALLFRASLDASQRGKAEPDPEDDAASLGEMTVGEQLEAAVRLRRRAKNAVEAVEQVSVEEGRVLRKRRLRLFQALSILFAIGCLLLLLRPILRGKDLLAGKPYRLSSSFAECHPEAHECGGNPRTRILFHTLDEESPWVEYDLGSVQRLSRIEVRNRTDDVTDRAVPLIVELGDEKRVWKQVARKNENFVEWTAKFPTASARYVRLRVDRRSALHLERVSARP